MDSRKVKHRRPSGSDSDSDSRSRNKKHTKSKAKVEEVWAKKKFVKHRKGDSLPAEEAVEEMLIEKPQIDNPDIIKDMEVILYNLTEDVGPKKRGVVDSIKPRPPRSKRTFKPQHFPYLQTHPKDVIALDEPDPPEQGSRMEDSDEEVVVVSSKKSSKRTQELELLERFQQGKGPFNGSKPEPLLKDEIFFDRKEIEEFFSNRML